MSAQKLSLVLFAVLLSGCKAQSQSPASVAAPQAPQLSWSVLRAFPHDPNAFTEGLLWHDGSLFESTGLKGQSDVRRVDLDSGEVLQRVALSPQLFGEGLAFAKGQFYNLTWQSKLGFVRNAKTLRAEKRFSYQDEGWGLTYNGKELIQSDGTDTLTFRNPDNFAAVHKLAVTWNGQPLKNLNELEWIDGTIWANVWQTDNIVLIDPETGSVKAFLNMTGLLPADKRTGNEDVLNGIAYDAKDKRIFVTEKTGPNFTGLSWTRTFMNYQQLDRLADSFNPVFGLLLLLLAIGLHGARVWPFLVRVVIALVICQQTAKFVQKHGHLGVHFPSTHFAVTLVIATALIFLEKRLWPLATILALGYGLLMLKQGYHTPVEMLGAVYAIPLTMIVLLVGRRRLSGGEKAVAVTQDHG